LPPHHIFKEEQLMKREKAIRFGQSWKRFTAAIITATLIAAYIPLAGTAVVEAGSPNYQVEISESTDATSGFVHPGVGLTKPILENVRTQIKAKAEPWNSYYEELRKHPSAAKDVTSSNQSAADPTKPDSLAFSSQGFNSRFIADGLKAYTQALMYVITGEEEYRANGMRIIRIWSQMDPAQYVYFTDSHIHTGIPLQRMVTAAEILRYTSSENPALAWTAQDTANFTNNLVKPTINTFMNSNAYFMNQHNYPILGAMAGYIFMDDKAGYAKEVEWWSVNKDAPNQGLNGSIERLFRLIDTNDVTGEPVNPPVIQHVEMGRDQAHGGGDLTNAAIAIRMLHAQGTKLDPVAGTVSTAGNAVEPLEFLDRRIVKAADFFWEYMLGYEPDWVPVAYSMESDGTIIDTYNRISSQYKGRFKTANFWDFYTYYTYEKGEDIAAIAPHYAEAFTKKQFMDWGNVDGGEEYWLYLPAAAKADAAKFLPPQQPNLGKQNEVEIRYTALDNDTQKLTEGDVQFIRFNATAAGAQIALLSGGTVSKKIGFKIRSNGVATLDLGHGIKDSLTLPNTHNEWRYVTYTMNAYQNLGDFLDLKIRGAAGVTVDIDHISFDAATLDGPAFQSGNATAEIFSYVGVPVNIDFSATGAPAAVIEYKGASLPQGAELDEATGAFSWMPTGAGTASFMVVAADGKSAAAKQAVVHVSADRASAITAATALYNPTTKYSEASLAQYNAVYAETVGKSATATDAEFIQQLRTLRAAVEGLQQVSPKATVSGEADESLDYSRVVSSPMGPNVALLLDGDNDTFAGFTTGDKPNQILDFGANYKVSATAFAVQSRMNFPDRGAGISIYGANDGATWTKLTPGQTPLSGDLKRLEVADALKNEKFRYIKIQMDYKHKDTLFRKVQGIMEIGEFRIYGERHEAGNRIEKVAFDSTQGFKGRVVLGDTVRVNIKATEAMNNVKVTIQGIEAQLYTDDNINWTASAVMNASATAGSIKVVVEYKQKNGLPGATAYSTTDDSKLNYVDESDVIQNVLDITDVTGSDARYNPEQTKNLMKNLFDNNELTFTEFWGLGANGHASYVTFDFKAGHQVSLSSIEFLARRDQLGRLGGAIVQGSNDMETWTALTDAAAGISDWQLMISKDKNTSYRYLRIYNPLFWFGNMAEVRFHGEVISTLPDLLTQAKALDRTLYTTASLQALDSAIAGGEAVIANSAATQANVNTAIANLQAALAGLAYEPGMPVLQLGDQTIAAGTALTFNVQAINVGAASVAYEVVEELPQGAAFDAAAHTFTWTPALNQGGVYSLTFKATAAGKTSQKTIKIKVIGEPVVDPAGIAPIDAKVGQFISFNVPVTSDASGKALVFTAAQLPGGASLNGINGKFQWTPTNADYGTHLITFKASNGSFNVDVPVQIDVALNILPAVDYTKASYYVYHNELTRIEAELNQPGANKVELARQISLAEKALVRVPLPFYSVVKDGESITSSVITGITTGTTSLVEGKESGRAVKFQAGTNDYLQLPSDVPFKNYDAITIATWVKWDGGSDWQRIFDFGNNTGQYLFLAPQSGAGNKELRFAIKNGGTEQLMDAGKLPIGEWTHVVVTLGNGKGQMYVNGVLKATNNNMTIKPSDFKPAINYIAKSQYPDPLYRGLVDEFTIYNYALSLEEVQAAMTTSMKWLDRTLLEKFRAEANELIESNYTAASWSVLAGALTAANAVSEAVAPAQSEVDNAANTLKAAIEQLVNVAALNTAIAEATALLASAEEGDEPGQYPSAAIEALEGQIAAASEVAGNAAVVQATVDGALAALEAAIEVFNASVIKEVEPEPATLVSLAVSPATVTLGVGGTKALSATATYSDETSTDVTATASYNTSDAAVATVSEAGVVTAVAAGTATITATFEGETATVEVTVTAETDPEPEPATLESLEVSPATVTLEVGGTKALSATATYSDETSKDVTATASYSTSDETVALVSEAGVVTAVAAGEATITATFDGETATAAVTVTAAPEPSEDTEAPTWQANSQVTATQVSTSSVTLTWSAAADNVAVTGYKVSWTAGGTSKEQATNGETTSISITGLSSGTSYTFKVEARDEAGNWSATGPSVTVSTNSIYVPPVTPEQPQQPSQPSQPEQPEQPEQPSQPEQPEQPTQPQVKFNDVPATHWAASAISRAAALGIVKGYSDQTFKPNASTTRAEFMTMLAKAFKWQGEAAAPSFKDNGQIGAWAKDAIAQGVERGIVSGYTDGSFRPNQQITRTEMIVMIARALGVSAANVEHSSFADDAAIPAWGKGAVEALREQGVVTGRGNNNFAPNDIATRAEALVIILRILEKNS
jgi:uncharacterized protein YjdB